MGAQADRPDRRARSDPMGAGPAEDALRQDHAPHPAQDRRERAATSSAISTTLADPSVVDDLVSNRMNKE